MKVKDYESFVMETAKEPIDKSSYSFVGLAGETGEVMEWYKKAVMRTSSTTTLTEDDLKRELGDVLHYVTRIGQAWGWSLKSIMKTNVEKLDKRYGRV